MDSGFVKDHSVIFSQSALRLYSRWGRGRGATQQRLSGEAPPRDLTPYTFIVEGARRVCLEVEPPCIKFNVTHFFSGSI